MAVAIRLRPRDLNLANEIRLKTILNTMLLETVLYDCLKNRFVIV